MAQYFTFYNRNTGDIEKVILTDTRSANRILEFNGDLVCVDGEYDWRKYRFDISETPPVPVLKTVTVTADYESLIRKFRDKKLASSDWTNGQDSPLSDSKRQEWAVYRQALRDITETYNANTVTTKEQFDNIVWPVKPT